MMGEKHFAILGRKPGRQCILHEFTAVKSVLSRRSGWCGSLPAKKWRRHLLQAKDMSKLPFLNR